MSLDHTSENCQGLGLKCDVVESTHVASSINQGQAQSPYVSSLKYTHRHALSQR